MTRPSPSSASSRTPTPTASTRGLRRPALDAVAEPGTLAAGEMTLTRSALLYARTRAAAHHEAVRRFELQPRPQAAAHRAQGPARRTWPPPAIQAPLLSPRTPSIPQFELLRQAFIGPAAPRWQGEGGKAVLSASAKRLRANMEMWRWMWDDLGELHVFNNIPEFMQSRVQGRRDHPLRRDRRRHARQAVARSFRGP